MSKVSLILVRLVVVHTNILSVQPPVATLKRTRMLFKVPTIREVILTNRKGIVFFSAIVLTTSLDHQVFLQTQIFRGMVITTKVIIQITELHLHPHKIKVIFPLQSDLLSKLHLHLMIG